MLQCERLFITCVNSCTSGGGVGSFSVISVMKRSENHPASHSIRPNLSRLKCNERVYRAISSMFGQIVQCKLQGRDRLEVSFVVTGAFMFFH